MNSALSRQDGARGTASHAVRDQIVEAADEYFSRYGYAKTTMADLAKAIGFSKAYLYKFFDSKQAIGEAICARYLGRHMAEAKRAVEAAKSPHDKIRALFRSLVEQSRGQFFSDRKLYDIVVHSCAERWSSSVAHQARIAALLEELVTAGRKAGAFERKTPVDEICHGIWYAMMPFVNPVMLEQHLDESAAGLNDVLGLVLRSLAP